MSTADGDRVSYTNRACTVGACDSVGYLRVGPENAGLKLLTVKRSAVALSGHELTIAVQKSHATLRIDGDAARWHSPPIPIPSTCSKERRNHRPDRRRQARIKRAINDDVLKGIPIEFRSTEVMLRGDALNVHGELDLAGERQEIMFELAVSVDGRLTGSACVARPTWGIKAFGDLRTAARGRRGSRRL